MKELFSNLKNKAALSRSVVNTVKCGIERYVADFKPVYLRHLAAMLNGPIAFFDAITIRWLPIHFQ
jgi:hypothetical protein